MSALYRYLLITGYCVLLCGPLPLHAQKQGQAFADSLAGVLVHTSGDKEQVGLLCALAQEYRNINPRRGLAYAGRALSCANRLQDKSSIANAHLVMGGNLAGLAEYPKALDHYFKALSRYEDLQDKEHIGITDGNIGWVYYQNNQDSLAIAYQRKAYDFFEQSGNRQRMAKMLSDMAVMEMEAEHFDTAHAYYQRALGISRAIANKDDIALVLGNLGNLELRQSHFDDALQRYAEALALCRQTGNKPGITRNLGNTGEVYLARYKSNPAQNRNVLGPAIACYRQAIAIAGQTGYLEAAMFYSQQLSEAYTLAGNPVAALAAFRDFKAVSDSITSADATARLGEIRTERELQLKDKQIIIDRLAVEKKRNERLFFGIGIGLLGLVLLFILRERKKSERLLLNILPRKIAQRLKQKEHPIADHFAEASIMFVDMAGFTAFSEQRDPKETVTMLNQVFTRFDALAEKWGLEKIKTIGDCYMAVAGLTVARPDHADAAAQMALEIQRGIKGFTADDGTEVSFRIGLDCGPVVAGVIGSKKFIYDLWGDAVNTASRMETTGVAGGVHCTARFRERLQNTYQFTSRGNTYIKGKGEMETWLLA